MSDSQLYVVQLSSTADPDAVEQLRKLLVERLALGASIRIDARELLEPSTSLIQLIEAAAADFATHDLSCALVEPSNELCQAYEDLGLYSMLMSRIAMTG